MSCDGKLHKVKFLIKLSLSSTFISLIDFNTKHKPKHTQALHMPIQCKHHLKTFGLANITILLFFLIFFSDKNNFDTQIFTRTQNYIRKNQNLDKKGNLLPKKMKISLDERQIKQQST